MEFVGAEASEVRRGDPAYRPQREQEACLEAISGPHRINDVDRRRLDF